MLYVQCESKRRHDKRVESGLGLGLGSLEWRWSRVVNGVDDGLMILADLTGRATVFCLLLLTNKLYNLLPSTSRC